MDFKREWKKAFTEEEFEQILDQATTEGNDLVAQMASVLLDTGKAMGMQYTREKKLIGEMKSFLAVADIWLPKDKETLGGKMSNYAKNKFLTFVDGVKSGKVKEEIVKFSWEHGKPFHVAYKKHWAMEIIAQGLADQMLKDDGEYWNNITCTLHYRDEEFAVTVQRKSGKSVKEQLTEAEAKVKELAAKLDEAVKNRDQYKPYYDAYYK